MILLVWSLREPGNDTGKVTGNVISFIAWLRTGVNPPIFDVLFLSKNVRDSTIATNSMHFSDC
jgi:hypothetical protein